MATTAKNEGRDLLGRPTFVDIGNGKFKCVETGHELTAKEVDSYAGSKRCRLGMIDAALIQNKSPFNVFKLDPLSRSKLICKLTGDTINKSEEHVWKHINGKRFLYKLEQIESGVVDAGQSKQRTKVILPSSKSKKREEKEKGVAEIISEIREPPKDESDLEDDDLWMLPEETGTGSSSDEKTTEDALNERCDVVSKELSKRTKRMTIEIGPSSFTTRKKKKKTDPTT